jgi:hypothetical protein
MTSVDLKELPIAAAIPASWASYTKSYMSFCSGENLPLAGMVRVHQQYNHGIPNPLETNSFSILFCCFNVMHMQPLLAPTIEG